MASVTTVGATGNKDIDGLLSGYKWSGTLSYSFPDQASDYSGGYGYGEPTAAGFAQISATQQAVAHKIMAQVEQFTNLNIDFAGTNGADIRLAQSSEANPTAYAYYPGSNEGGDVWFGTSYNYRNPKLGDYYYLTHVHEIGHALGLKHSQETGGPGNTAVPTAHDALEYTVMSYRSFVGGPTTGYTNETYGYPTTYMMNDIRALQEMYGANFTTNSGNTVYSWSPSTGEFFIDGAGQGQPGGSGASASANVVFMTVWDGGGNDTYDFSNYTSALTVNLNPGAYSLTSATQLAYLGGSQSAHGNVYNAYLYNNDARSYIENAIGGSGNDRLIGNAADNRLDGGAGNDTLTGGAGGDTFVFHSGYGADIVTDYSVGFDHIDFTGFAGFDSLFDILAVASQMGANAIFNFGLSLSLTLQNVTLGALSIADFIFDSASSGSPDEAPTAISLAGMTVDENHAGAIVGGISVTDPDDTAFSFLVSDDRFEVSGGPGAYMLKLVSGVALDYETEPTVNLSVIATDGDGLSVTDDFALFVNDLPGATITGTNARDIIDGTRTVHGGLLATNDADIIHAGNGNDTVSALGGNDLIDGGSGNDILYGDAGDDRIIGGVGADRLYGGDGNDVFAIGGGEGLSDTISGGAGSDTIEVTGTTYVMLSRFSAMNSSIEIWDGNDQFVLGTSGNDVLDFSGLQSISGVTYIDGAGGNDSLGGTADADDLRGGSGKDTIYGHEGNDRLNGGAGVDTLDGGDGDDTFTFGAAEANGDVMRGGAGFDTIEIAGAPSVTLARFDALAQSIEAWHGNDAGVRGTSAADVLDFSGLIDVSRLGIVDGGNGNDRLVGTYAADDLRGSGGNDVLIGGLGDDLLHGGAGNDRFVFDAGFGHDVIADFAAGPQTSDVIALSGTLLSSFSGVLAASHQEGADVVIDMGADSLTLQHILLSNLHANDFAFF